MSRRVEERLYAGYPNHESASLPDNLPFNAVPLYGTITSEPFYDYKQVVPFNRRVSKIKNSGMAPGAQLLLDGLLTHGDMKLLQSGNVDFATLLGKQVDIRGLLLHLKETAKTLDLHLIDLIAFPQLSRMPIGELYAAAAQIPALRFEKEEPGIKNDHYPIGTFTFPSDARENTVLMPVIDTVSEAVNLRLREQIDRQADAAEPFLSIRAAISDNMLDDRTMARGLAVATHQVGQQLIGRFVKDYREQTNDQRDIVGAVSVPIMVTPFMTMDRADKHLIETTGTSPLCGVPIANIDPGNNAVGIVGMGLMQFKK